MKVTYKDANTHVNAGNSFINDKDRKPSDLSYALSKTAKRLKSHIADYVEMVEDAKVECQAKDKDGILLYNDPACTIPKYTPEKQIELRKRIRKIQETEFEFEPYLATSIPEDLPLVWYEFFVPFVIADQPRGLQQEVA